MRLRPQDVLLAVFCTGPGFDRLGNLSLPEERQTQTLAVVSLPSYERVVPHGR